MPYVLIIRYDTTPPLSHLSQCWVIRDLLSYDKQRWVCLIPVPTNGETDLLVGDFPLCVSSMAFANALGLSRPSDLMGLGLIFPLEIASKS